MGSAGVNSPKTEPMPALRSAPTITCSFPSIPSSPALPLLPTSALLMCPGQTKDLYLGASTARSAGIGCVSGIPRYVQKHECATLYGSVVVGIVVDGMVVVVSGGHTSTPGGGSVK